MSDGLGVWLRRTRETQQLTLEDAERSLRIRRRYLQALEMGDYTALPGEIQARGFLRNYARFLNLPVEETLARYDAEMQGRPVQPRAQTRPQEVVPRQIDRPSVFSPPPSAEEERVATRSQVPQGLFLILVGAMAFFALVALGSWLWLMWANGPQGEAAEPTATMVQTSVPQAESGTVVPEVFVPAPDGRVSVRLTATEHAWVSISADATVIFQGVAETGQVLEASAEEMLIIATGNGGAFQVYINGTDWGTLGAQGEVVRRAWGPQGEISLEDM